ncbi:MAG: CHASE domain-containing protein [Opitutaceae bacterium]|nr:CHASE domain-containing protein [Opitutaceae bacterium]
MMAAPRTPAFLSHRGVILGVLLVGLIASVVSFQIVRAGERQAAETDFARRTTVRHTLTREVLGRYEDSLFGLSALFMLDATVTRSEFIRATSRLEERLGGVQAFEWVPVVAHAQRARFEADLQRYYESRSFAIVERDASGLPQRAANRPVYYPISYIQPLRGNEAALGYDLSTGPTNAFLQQARETRQVLVTPPVPLVQGRPGQRGVVMIWPVYRVPKTGQPEDGAFNGFLQCVFRLPDMLDAACRRQPDTMMDMLFVDASEPDPVKRVLYYRAANGTSPGEAGVTEEEFRRDPAQEHSILFGGRDWRVLYRPRVGWLAEQNTWRPLVRSIGLMLLSGLVAGLAHITGRRTETIRREVEQRTAELAESRRHFASMLHALPGMAFRCRYDEQLTVLFVSDGAQHLTGWTAAEFLNGTVHFRDCVHPDDLQRVREATRGALHDGSDIEVEYRIRHRSGEEKWVLSRGRGGYSAEGRRDIFEGLAIDITAQKNAEAARLGLERKLLEGQKLESLGLLAGGIAHDFNNLLSTILGNATLARLSLPGNSAVEPQLSAIENASLRAAELCRQMLAYAGKGQFVIEPTDLTAMTEELLPLLKISVARQATLTLNLPKDLPAVLADATQLRQIVMNLVLNAADAIGDRGGEIILTAGMMHADHAMLAGCVAGAALPGGDYVYLEVRDTGCGMTPEVMAKIFDPFFTTKFAGRGLGLAAVLGIVRGHKGALRVTSAPGHGSSFRLLLPPVAAVARPLATPAASGGRWRSSASVLVVEDEELVRLVVMDTLKTFGLKPHGAADGAAAVDIFREKSRDFDLVVLDLLMPGLSGEQTLERLRAMRADVPVLLMSGYSEGDILGRVGGAGRLAFLAKPFTRDALERKLRELIP